ncbi:hypothetical protein ACT4US_31815, partial [Bacillus sp. HC-Mk]
LEIVVASVAKGNEKKRPSASLLIGIFIYARKFMCKIKSYFRIRMKFQFIIKHILCNICDK